MFKLFKVMLNELWLTVTKFFKFIGSDGSIKLSKQFIHLVAAPPIDIKDAESMNTVNLILRNMGLFLKIASIHFYGRPTFIVEEL